MNTVPLIVLGVITSAHGVRGAAKIKPFTQSPDDLLRYGTLTDRSGKPYQIKVTGELKGQLICTIEGITDRNEVERLRGTELCVPRSALPESADDEYYIEDLIGLSVQLDDGTPYGHITQVYNVGAGDIIDITRASDGKSESLPFTDAIFPAIDIAKGIVTLSPPQYLQAGDASHEQA